MRVLLESVPNMLLIGKSCITISATGSCNDPDLGNCKLVEEQRKLVHPRLSFFRLSHREIRKANVSEKEPVVDENILPVPILNRLKNSTLTFWPHYLCMRYFEVFSVVRALSMEHLTFSNNRGSFTNYDADTRVRHGHTPLRSQEPVRTLCTLNFRVYVQLRWKIL